MLNQVRFLKKLPEIGLLMAVIFASTSGALAAEIHSEKSTNSAPITTQFRRIEQPLANKLVVTFAGLGLIGLELWWFLLSKPTSQKQDLRS